MRGAGLFPSRGWLVPAALRTLRAGKVHIHICDGTAQDHKKEQSQVSDYLIGK